MTPHERIVNHYGAPAQLAKMAEECSELAAKINKYLSWKLHNPAADTSEIEKGIIEEVADVENVLPQMRFVFDGDQIDRIKTQKLERTFEGMVNNE